MHFPVKAGSVLLLHCVGCPYRRPWNEAGRRLSWPLCLVHHISSPARLTCAWNTFLGGLLATLDLRGALQPGRIFAAHGKDWMKPSQYPECLARKADVPTCTTISPFIGVSLNLSESVEHTAMALMLDPGFGRCRTTIWRRSRRLGPAGRHWNTSSAVKLTRVFLPKPNLGRALQKLGQPGCRLQPLRCAVRLKPVMTHAQLTLGLLLPSKAVPESPLHSLTQVTPAEATNATLYILMRNYGRRAK